MAHESTWPHDAALHAWWVEPGRLLAGEYPGSRSDPEAVSKLRLLMDAGVDRRPYDRRGRASPVQPPVEGCRGEPWPPGAYLSRPIADMTAATPRTIDRILVDIHNALDAGRVVYVHCWKGLGRTGTVIGCRLIDSDLDYRSTIGRIAALRAGTRKAGSAVRRQRPSIIFCTTARQATLRFCDADKRHTVSPASTLGNPAGSQSDSMRWPEGGSCAPRAPG